MLKIFGGFLLGGIFVFGWLAIKLAPVLKHFSSLPEDEKKHVILEFEKTKPWYKATE